MGTDSERPRIAVYGQWRGIWRALALLCCAASSAFAVGPFQVYHGFCQQGATKIATAGMSSTNVAMGSFPLCTVTVYLNGGAVGTVNTNGTAVSWVSGTPFGSWNGQSITINSVIYTINTVTSSTSLSLMTTAGVQNGVAYAKSPALAVLYSDSSGSLTSNPITADANGYFSFYAINGRYNIQRSGTVPAWTEYDATFGLYGDASALTYTAPGAGAVPRTVQGRLGDTVSVKDFGATGNGTTDDSAAIQTALNDVASGGTLNFPNGTYRIAPTTGTEALLLEKPVSLAGSAALAFDLPAAKTASVTACSEAPSGVVTITASNAFLTGWHGQFDSAFSGACAFLDGAMFDVATASSTQFTFYFQGAPLAGGGSDTGGATANMAEIRVAPQLGAGSAWWGWSMKDLTLAGASGLASSASNATAGIVFDCSVGSDTTLGGIRLQNLTLGGQSAGYSVYMNNTSAGSAEGCLVTSNFIDNAFQAGVYLYNSGDTLNIEGGRITNPYGDGINLWSINGAIRNKIEHINIITGGAPIHIRRAEFLSIKDNEVGIHNYGGSPVPLVAPAGTIWLDGTAAQNSVSVIATSDVTLEDNHVGTDQLGANSFALPNLQIDKGVQNTVIKSNGWNPQYVSGVPYPAIMNNGWKTTLGQPQSIYGLTPNGGFPATFIGGSGSLGDSDFLSQNGLGDVYENLLQYSEDATQSPWTTSVSGTGTISVSTQTGVVLPDGTVGSATRVQMAIASTGDAELVQFISGLSNPHASAARAWIRNTTCADPPVVVLFGAYGSILPDAADCTGDANGWRPITSALNSNVASASDYVLLLVDADPGVSMSADVLITYMQFGANFSKYVKTTATPVPLSYGVNAARPVSLPQSPFGFQDTSTGPLPPCNALSRGTIYDGKSVGLDLPQQCQLTNASPAIYGWMPYAMLAPSQENYLLQSNTWGTSPWSLIGYAGGTTPAITPEAGISDPFGNTGTVQEVDLNVTGSTPNTGTSYVEQNVTEPSGLGPTAGIWMKAKSGAPFLVFFELDSTRGCTNSPPVRTITSAWQYFSLTCPGGNATDQLLLGILNQVGIYPQIADLYVFGACMTYYNGSCTNPAGAPITTTTTAIRTGLLLTSGTISATNGFKVAAANGITETCTVIPTGITIVGGIITAITGGTCTP